MDYVKFTPEDIHFDIDMSDFFFELEWAKPIDYVWDDPDDLIQHYNAYLKAKKLRTKNH